MNGPGAYSVVKRNTDILNSEAIKRVIRNAIASCMAKGLASVNRVIFHEAGGGWGGGGGGGGGWGGGVFSGWKFACQLDLLGRQEPAARADPASDVSNTTLPQFSRARRCRAQP